MHAALHIVCIQLTLFSQHQFYHSETINNIFTKQLQYSTILALVMQIACAWGPFYTVGKYRNEVINLTPCHFWTWAQRPHLFSSLWSWVGVMMFLYFTVRWELLPRVPRGVSNSVCGFRARPSSFPFTVPEVPLLQLLSAFVRNQLLKAVPSSSLLSSHLTRDQFISPKGKWSQSF